MPRSSGCVLAKCVAMQCVAMQCVAMQCVAMQCVGPYVTGDNRAYRLEIFQLENSMVRSIFHTAESFHKILQIGNFTLV